MMFHGVPYSPFYITSFTLCKKTVQSTGLGSLLKPRNVYVVQASDLSWRDGHAVRDRCQAAR